jgi:hypothetical protein
MGPPEQLERSEESVDQTQALADRSPSIQGPAPVSVTVCPHYGGPALAISLRGLRQPKAGHGIRYALKSPLHQCHEHPKEQRGWCHTPLSPPAEAGGYHPSYTWQAAAVQALHTPDRSFQISWKTRIRPGFQRSCPPFSGVNHVPTPTPKRSAIGDVAMPLSLALTSLSPNGGQNGYAYADDTTPKGRKYKDRKRDLLNIEVHYLSETPK